MRCPACGAFFLLKQDGSTHDAVPDGAKAGFGSLDLPNVPAITPKKRNDLN
jgi:hypothetical protein